MKRNPLLTERMYRMLEAMREGDDEYAIVEGGEVWVDYQRFAKSTFHKLLQLCLISADSCNKDGHAEIWILNEEGRAIIGDPKYVPLILKAGRT